MPAAAQVPYSADLKLEYGVTETVALKYLQGKSVESRFPGGRCMFSLTDGRKLFLNDEDGLDLQHRLTDLRIQPGEPIKLTKIKHPHGGGHSLRVERAEPAEPELERNLKQSIEMAQRGERLAPPVQPVAAPAAPVAGSPKLMACFMQSIDAIAEAQAYANRKGLGITFSSEDVRATAISCWISVCRDGR
jgi:hypothetical protein